MTLAERQTGALFGQIEALQREMQEALEELGGSEAEFGSMEELMQRVQEAVEEGKVRTGLGLGLGLELGLGLGV